MSVFESVNFGRACDGFNEPQGDVPKYVDQDHWIMQFFLLAARSGFGDSGLTKIPNNMLSLRDKERGGTAFLPILRP